MSGNDRGGRQINLQLQTRLEEILTEKFAKKINTKAPEFWMYILEVFESTKKMVVNEHGEDIFIEKEQCLIKWPKYLNNQVKISGDDVYKIIENHSKEITEHIVDILESMGGIEAVLLVGGFAKSPILNDVIREQLRKDLLIIVPENPDLCVVQGAVMFGQMKDIILSRKSRYTYGFNCMRDFEDSIHSPDPSKIFVSDTRKMAKDCFHRLVEENEDVCLDDVKSFTVRHLPTDSKNTTIYLCCSTIKSDPTYCDEEGVEVIGKLTLPKREESKEQPITLEVKFGQTELHIFVKDELTGKTYEKYLTF